MYWERIDSSDEAEEMRSFDAYQVQMLLFLNERVRLENLVALC